MKRRNYIFGVMGVLLSCQLVLSACQNQETKKETTAKTHQETKKSKKTKKSAKSNATKKKDAPKNKGVSGVDYPTDDGFLFSSEAQIQSKTADGLILKHGNHSHFIFYSELKGTKWAYLIPEEYVETAKPNSSISSTNQAVGNYQLDDGYVFNPNDIVAEDANGYTVRHGDHYHYIFKSQLSNTQKEQTNQLIRTQPLPIAPPTIQTQNGIPGLDYPTSDGFLFTGHNITGSTTTGILVGHNGHLHSLSFNDLKKSRWAYLVEEYQKSQVKQPAPSTEKKTLTPKEPAPSKEEQLPELPDSSNEEKTPTPEKKPTYQKEISYLAAGLGIDPSLIKLIETNEGEIGFEYPHEDHSHVIMLKDIDITQPFKTPEEDIEETLEETIDGETLEERKERLIKEFMERYQVRREDITIKGNYMSIRHGDHAHIYKIDPSLPDDPERDETTETTNLEIETGTVYGPFYPDVHQARMSKADVKDYFKVDDVQNIKNFILLEFSSENEFGDLKGNDGLVNRIYYLVRKDLDWSELEISMPETMAKEKSLFKGWREEMPTSGKMPRESQHFIASFDKIRKAPTKDVYGPFDDTTGIDLSDFTAIRYTTITNGRLELDGNIQGGFIYLVNRNLTWAEAKEKGMKIPTPVPNEGFEFIEWRNVSVSEIDENSPVNAAINLAAFGTTSLKIGPYLAQNPDHPTDKNDPQRHPNYYWHNPEKYAAVAFQADENGELISPVGRGRAVVYLIRKGTSLSQAGIFPPATQAKDGYVAGDMSHIIANFNKPVEEDTTYTISFTKREELPKNDDLDDPFGPDYDPFTPESDDLADPFGEDFDPFPPGFDESDDPFPPTSEETTDESSSPKEEPTPMINDLDDLLASNVDETANPTPISDELANFEY
ncbi:pneumococcal-type histidine triad protein [Streptococcus sp. CSL10205-OR2]|uniref:pneumococcal-type histidine triad protein n=1 Tax=Streptococcus sp. CSL10205-OR2 TaxID=2980558 RepID=UPI0021DAD829|nr:pneumococcal-type histidine triad protein [Streptococcus sp. CSL10205-OR2]MCU9533058.1 pneumococcal-type histidine triad protein [Streptococcus sp. CSL10205-OR2]